MMTIERDVRRGQDYYCAQRADQFLPFCLMRIKNHVYARNGTNTATKMQQRHQAGQCGRRFCRNIVDGSPARAIKHGRRPLKRFVHVRLQSRGCGGFTHSSPVGRPPHREDPQRAGRISVSTRDD